MGLTNEHVGSKILAKIKIYILRRAELLCSLCYEIPCSINEQQPTRNTSFATKNNLTFYIGTYVFSAYYFHEKMGYQKIVTTINATFFLRLPILVCI